MLCLVGARELWPFSIRLMVVTSTLARRANSALESPAAFLNFLRLFEEDAFSRFFTVYKDNTVAYQDYDDNHLHSIGSMYLPWFTCLCSIP